MKRKKKKSLGVNEQDGILRNSIWGSGVLSQGVERGSQEQQQPKSSFIEI